jgi:hypothetical protein
MTDAQWRNFFQICARTLGRGERRDWASANWCAWTTFGTLRGGVHYWTAGLPNQEDIGDIGTNDSGPWGQPFLYSDLAHIVIPRQFDWEKTENGTYTQGTRTQDLERLSLELTQAGIAHRKTDLVLEIKLY